LYCLLYCSLLRLCSSWNFFYFSCFTVKVITEAKKFWCTVCSVYVWSLWKECSTGVSGPFDVLGWNLSHQSLRGLCSCNIQSHRSSNPKLLIGLFGPVAVTLTVIQNSTFAIYYILCSIFIFHVWNWYCFVFWPELWNPFSLLIRRKFFFNIFVLLHFLILIGQVSWVVTYLTCVLEVSNSKFGWNIWFGLYCGFAL